MKSKSRPTPYLGHRSFAVSMSSATSKFFLENVVRPTLPDSILLNALLSGSCKTHAIIVCCDKIPNECKRALSNVLLSLAARFPLETNNETSIALPLYWWMLPHVSRVGRKLCRRSLNIVKETRVQTILVGFTVLPKRRACQECCC